MKLINKLLAGSILAALSISSTFAAATTSNFQSTATLASTCVISATNINFGLLGIEYIQGGTSSTGSLSTLCSSGVSYTLSFNQELTLTGSSAFRGEMHGAIVGNTDTINVHLFFPNSLVTQPGVGTGATETRTLQATIVSNNTTNYGLATPDNYIANVTVNIAY